jgi:hypothetical protein
MKSTVFTDRWDTVTRNVKIGGVKSLDVKYRFFGLWYRPITWRVIRGYQMEIETN